MAQRSDEKSPTQSFPYHLCNRLSVLEGETEITFGYYILHPHEVLNIKWFVETIDTP